MRTATLAFTVLTVVSPLALAAPLAVPGHAIANGTPGTLASVLHNRDTAVVRRPVVGTVVSSGFPRVSPPQQLSARALDKDTAGGNAYSGSAGDAPGGGVTSASYGHVSITHNSRTDDADTLGGNAYTGNSADASGGSITDISNDAGMPTLMNIDSNNAGIGGTSTSGCASGGYTTKSAAAGNAYSGSAGNAEGGSVSEVGGMINYESNNAGKAGISSTGCATGGDVGKLPDTTSQNLNL
ncbi:hypothetical protein C8Q72DRAFT_944513 [Fomitopsis betulina]|nr:hypothetical protein C8Q72DRAFT_944513 [Fomitopsis betulina]